MTADMFEHEEFSQKERQVGTKQAFKRLIPFLLEHKKRLITSLILLAIATGLSVSWPLLLQEALGEPLDTGNTTMLLYYAGAIAILQLVALILQYLMRIKLEVIGQDIMLSLKRKLFDHVLSLDVSFFHRKPVGRLMARIESDTESLRLLFTNSVVLVVADLLLLVGIYAILFYTHWRLSAILFITIPTIGLLVWIFHRLTSHRFLEVRKRMAEVTAALTEFLHGMSIVQIFHRGQWARDKVFQTNKRKFDEDAWANIAVVIFFNSVFLFEYVKIGLVLIFASVWNIPFRAM